jgi:hypothetical protein
MNTHNLKILAGLAIIFLIGAFSAFKGGFSTANVLDMVVAGLIALEHALNGNTGTPTPPSTQ